jgi:uncharacterized RDD family membrane protein YckC
MLPNQPPPESITDGLTIETPEQMTVEFKVAGIGSRFLAMAVDTLIQIGIGIVLLLIFVALATGGAFTWMRGSAVWIGGAAVAIVFLLTFGYFAIFEIMWNGQTPGKRVIGIRVVKDSGRPLTPPETIGRNLLRIVDQLPAFYALGIVVALCNAQNRRLGDFLAGSIVVREGSLAEIKPVWQARETPPAPSGPVPILPVAGVSSLSIEDLVLMDTFLNRRSDLSADVRARMADEILRKLAPKLSLPPLGDRSAESILETLAYQRRSSGAYS